MDDAIDAGDAVDTAVVLAAGMGTRLRGRLVPKPLVPVAGATLLSRVLAALAGRVRRAVVVVGWRADEVSAEIAARPVAGLDVTTVHNPRWQEPNGVSVLAARAALSSGRALLTMCDHVFDPSALDRLCALPRGGADTVLLVDRDAGGVFDLGDATKVRLQGDRIADIGKDLPRYDAIDTGLFLAAPALIDALHALPSPSLSDGMRALARLGLARTIDIGGAWWQDVDDEAMLAQAEALLARVGDPMAAAAAPGAGRG